MKKNLFILLITICSCTTVKEYEFIKTKEEFGKTRVLINDTINYSKNTFQFLQKIDTLIELEHKEISKDSFIYSRKSYAFDTISNNKLVSIIERDGSFFWNYFKDTFENLYLKNNPSFNARSMHNWHGKFHFNKDTSIKINQKETLCAWYQVHNTKNTGDLRKTCPPGTKREDVFFNKKNGIPMVSIFYEYDVHRIYKNEGWENMNEDGTFNPDTLLSIYMDTIKITYRLNPLD